MGPVIRPGRFAPPRRSARFVAATLLAVGAAACSGANQSGQMQVPGIVSGVVEGRPPCAPGRACSFLVALVPNALVEAVGKDGTHWARADAHGHYQLALLDGTWTLSARRTINASAGPQVRIQVSPGGSATVDLQVTLG